jgi:hypothetical protein
MFQMPDNHRSIQLDSFSSSHNLPLRPVVGALVFLRHVLNPEPHEMGVAVGEDGVEGGDTSGAGGALGDHASITQTSIISPASAK